VTRCDPALAILTIGCAIACAALVVAEWRAVVRLRIAAKLGASAAFVAVGLRAYQLGPGAGPGDAPLAWFGQAIVAGLVLGAIGDACLLAAGKRWFLVGLASFLLGHLAYVAGIAQIAPVERWLPDAGALAAIPVAIGLVVLARLWPRIRGSGVMRLAVPAYVVTICVMAIAAIAVARGTALPPANRCRLVTGACLFFVSDLSVARDRFMAKGFANKLWGLPTYYAGQLLIAWTLAGL
jgi:uncharacterized membrane protein YhhN